MAPRFAVPVYRVFPDYSADPVWGPEGMENLDRLPMTDELRRDLRAWAVQWEELVGAPEGRYDVVDHAAYEVWRKAGRGLTKRLQVELGHLGEFRFEGCRAGVLAESARSSRWRHAPPTRRSTVRCLHLGEILA